MGKTDDLKIQVVGGRAGNDRERVKWHDSWDGLHEKSQ